MLDFWLNEKIDWQSILTSENIDLKHELWNKIESLRSPTPYVEQIETTNRCSFTCLMCPRGQGKMTRPLAEMDTHLFQSLALQIEDSWMQRIKTERDPKYLVGLTPSDYIEEIGLRLHHFGSPLMDKNFINRVEWLKKTCSYPIHTSISAEQLNKTKAEKFIASGIDRIVIALDGNDKNVYKFLRGNSANYNKSCENIELLVNIKEKLKLNTLIDIQLIDFCYSEQELKKFSDKWLDYGVNPLIKSFFPYPDIKKNIFTNAKTWDDFCIWSFLSMVVTVEGLVVPCCSDYNAENILGDVNKSSLEAIWHGEKYRDFRRKFFFNIFENNSLCHRCGYFKRGSF